MIDDAHGVMNFTPMYDKRPQKNTAPTARKHYQGMKYHICVRAQHIKLPR